MRIRIRHTIIRVLSLWVVASCAVPYLSMAQVSIAPFQDQGLRIITLSSPEGDAALRSLIQNAQTISTILPYCVFLENNASLPIVGVHYRVDLQNESGVPISHQFLSYSRVLDLARSLKPTERRLLCPDLQVAEAVRSGRAANLSLPANVNQRLSLYQKQQVTLSVDAAIFADGGVAGPDRSGIIIKINQEADAEDDLVHSLRVMPRRTPQIVEYLERVIRQAGESAPAQGRTDYYQRHQREMAQHFLKSLAAQQEVSFFAGLDEFVRTPKVPILHKR
jgi:hypothetical protein